MEGYSIVETLQKNINSSFVGKENVVEDVLICLLAGGHILLEDVPGVGKTTLASALAKSIGSSFGRIQFTPDTLPTDVSGASIYNMKTGNFEYRAGVVMNQIILADEINRTAPKTQASLLEAMAEKQVTVDGTTYALPQLFMVIATQNPIEFLGTYPLPEAQMDRFMMRISIGYPRREEEIKMATLHLKGETPELMKEVCSVADVLGVKESVASVTVSEDILGYIEDIVALTRQEERFVLGASPRALLALVRASQAKAFLNKRDYVKPDDVKAVAVQVLAHRITLSPEAKIRKEKVADILKSLVLKVKVPV